MNSPMIKILSNRYDVQFAVNTAKRNTHIQVLQKSNQGKPSKNKELIRRP